MIKTRSPYVQSCHVTRTRAMGSTGRPTTSLCALTAGCGNQRCGFQSPSIAPGVVPAEKKKTMQTEAKADGRGYGSRIRRYRGGRARCRGAVDAWHADMAPRSQGGCLMEGRRRWGSAAGEMLRPRQEVDCNRSGETCSGGNEDKAPSPGRCQFQSYRRPGTASDGRMQ